MEADRSLRRYALLITTVSSFLAPFMGSATDLALKTIGDRNNLNAEAFWLTWVQLIYLLTSAAFLLPFGRAADLYGRKKVYLVGLGVYAVASGLAALSPTIEWLIAARALQGAGGAMVFGTAVATLTSIYPASERGRVLGVNTAAVYIGLTLGPALGGVMTQHLGWRSLFVFVGALALGDLVLALFKLRGEWAGAMGERFDWSGAFLYVASLPALLYGVSSIYRAWYARWLLLGGVVGLIAFVILQTFGKSPVLDLRRFRGNIVFLFSNLAALIHYSATFAVAQLLSLYLQVVKGMTPQEAGPVLLVQPLVMAILSPFTGWLSERIQPRLLASTGMGMMAGGLFVFSLLESGTPLLLVVDVSLLMGLGFGLFSAPNTNAVMGAVPRTDYGVASSTLGTMRLVGQALSMAIVALFVSIYAGQVKMDELAPGDLLAVLNASFRVFTVLCLLGIGASLARGSVRRASR